MAQWQSMFGGCIAEMIHAYHATDWTETETPY